MNAEQSQAHRRAIRGVRNTATNLDCLAEDAACIGNSALAFTLETAADALRAYAKQASGAVTQATQDEFDESKRQIGSILSTLIEGQQADG